MMIEVFTLLDGIGRCGFYDCEPQQTRFVSLAHVGWNCSEPPIVATRPEETD